MELPAVDFTSNSFSLYIFKRPYCCGIVPMLKVRINESIDHRCNWNEGDILYSERESVVHREASSSIAIYCFGPHKLQFICGFIERTVFHIIQTGCTSPTDKSLPAMSCMCACHKKSKHFCVLRTTYSIAQRLNIHILTLQYAKCPPQPVFH